MNVWKRLQGSCRCVCRSRIWFLLPGLAGVTVFVLFPFLDVGRRSFQTAVTGQFCGMENYRKVFENRAFQLAVGNTLKFVAVGLPLLLGLSLLLAVLLDHCVHAQIWKAIYLFPLAIPTAAVVLIWKLLFHKNGLLNVGLAHFGGSGADWMGSDLSFWVLIVSYLWKNTGYTVVLWLAGLHCIPKELREAARADGANRRQGFFYVILPQLKPMLYTITILSFLNSFKIFREAYLVAGAYPQEKMYLLQHLFNNWFTNLEIDKMAAAGVCITAVFLVGAVLLKRLWDRQIFE